MNTYALAPLSDRQQKERSKKRLIGTMLSAATLAGRLRGLTRAGEDCTHSGVKLRGISEDLANTLNALNTNYQNMRPTHFDENAFSELDAHARGLIDYSNTWEMSRNWSESVECSDKIRDITFEVVGTLQYISDHL